MTLACKFESVSKRYTLGRTHYSIRGALSSLPSRLLALNGKPSKRSTQLWALRDVSFEIQRGEAFGIIGPNGAGKTTLLKLLSRVTRQTEGNIVVDGRVAALIELGAGFHPDLTGRENVYLNGSILGLSRKDISQRFDEIVDFAEIEPFIDTPVKRYSSGMYARLGFAVAAHVDAELLLVDEVLAVGDASFQAKCYRRMKSLRDNGSTVVLVSHQIPLVQRVCDRVLLLAGGKVSALGPTEEVVSAYYHTLESEMPTLGHVTRVDAREDAVILTNVSTRDRSGADVDAFEMGDDVIIRLEYLSVREIRDLTFSISLQSSDESIYTGWVTYFDGFEVPIVDGSGIIELVLPNLGLGSGLYDVHAGIWDKDYEVPFSWKWNVARFGVSSSRQKMLGRFSLPHHWRLAESNETLQRYESGAFSDVR